MGEKEGPIHLYDRDAHGHLTQIACGTPVRVGPSVTSGMNYTPDPTKASCRACARQAKHLTDEQREEIWQNAMDRLQWNAVSPFMKARKKREREERRKARLAEAAARATRVAARKMAKIAKSTPMEAT